MGKGAYESRGWTAMQLTAFRFATPEGEGIKFPYCLLCVKMWSDGRSEILK